MPKTRRRKPIRWPIWILAGVASAASAAPCDQLASLSLADTAHRAVHQLAVVAKALTEAYYERPHERAYFAGCSTGGRQALTAAQRYPEDFDGIVAGAPAYYPSHIQGMQVWTAAVSNRSDAARIADVDFAAGVERIDPLMNANDVNLSEFVERGGKLLLYHDWNDPGIPPGGTIRYYDAVQAKLAESGTDSSVQLFMVPGMNHCAGGTGTDRFDAVNFSCR